MPDIIELTNRIKAAASGISAVADTIADEALDIAPVELPDIYIKPGTPDEAILDYYFDWKRGGVTDINPDINPDSDPPPPPPDTDIDVIPTGPMLWWESRTPNDNFGLRHPFSSASIGGKIPGAYNIRVLHGNHPSHRAWMTNRDAVRAFYGQAAQEGVDALGLDDENEAWDRNVYSMIADEAHRTRLPFVSFTKVVHKLNGPGYRRGINGYQEDINFWNDLGVDASVEWLYGDSAHNINNANLLDSAGFLGQSGEMHDLFRWQPDRGYKGKVEGWKVLDYSARNNRVFGSFQHGHSGHLDPTGDARRMNAAYGR